MKENIREQYNQLTPENAEKIQRVIFALLDMQQHPEDAPKTLRERAALAFAMAGVTEEEAAPVLANIKE